MNDIKTLLALYSISAPSNFEKNMQKFMKSELKKAGAKVTTDKTGNIYATKGIADTYPCIVAHLDEVHDEKTDGFKVYQVSDTLFGFNDKINKFVGIGADDKNGLFIALQLFKKHKVIKGAFFVGEEIGCIGSHAADMNFFKNVRYCVQPDRRGASDLINEIGMTEICSDAFLEDISTLMIDYKYKACSGLMTDVQTLVLNKVGVSCINVSCGYYEPHTSNEHTNLIDLQKCLNFIDAIFNTLTDTYVHMPVIKEYSKYRGFNRGDILYSDWYDDFTAFSDFTGSNNQVAAYGENYELLSEIIEFIKDTIAEAKTGINTSDLTDTIFDNFNDATFDDVNNAMLETIGVSAYSNEMIDAKLFKESTL